MARSCHWFGIGGPNCTKDCPEECFGDYTAPLAELFARMKDFQQGFLGYCEHHGTPIMVRTTDEHGVVSHMVPWEPAREATMSLDDWKRSMGSEPRDSITYGECHCSHPGGRAHRACAGGCPPDCLGDFTEPARLFAWKMRIGRMHIADIPFVPTRPIHPSWVPGRKRNVVNWVGRRVLLGTCDLHGNVSLVGLFDGKLYIDQTMTWPPDTWGM